MRDRQLLGSTATGGLGQEEPVDNRESSRSTVELTTTPRGAMPLYV
jgi:hypothetical protein